MSEPAAASPGRRLCIIGGDGRIGRALAGHLTARGERVFATTRQPHGSAEAHLDLDRAEAWTGPPEGTTAAFLCAAVTDMAQCEARPEHARRINVESAMILSQRLAANGIRVVFLSTNAVFSGDVPDVPEDAIPDPLNAYGRLKQEAEQAVLALGPLGVVVRLGKVLDATLPLLAGWRDRLDRGETVRPFSDLRMAPVSLDYVCALLAQVADRDVAGVLHASGAASVSYAAFLQAYARARGNRDGLVEPVTSTEAGVRLPACPAHATLGMARTRDLLGVTPQPVEGVVDDLLRGERA